ncbi:MAG: AAA family ATPase [Pirellulaceae bacterium]
MPDNTADRQPMQAAAVGVRLGGQTQTLTNEPNQPDRSVSDQHQQPPDQRLKASLQELDQLIGLSQVKERIRSLANYLKLQNQRAAAGLPTMPISLHMAFVGNPGTGKTSVARIVGQILGAMGVVRQGHVVETDRSGLVAEFAGQTAVKTNKLIDSALDGVLFIDEAYSLVDESGDDAFGREAIQTLLKRMEDDRSRLVVILAGYPNEMESMIRSNPGLGSRIGTTLQFEDYDPVALGKIFEVLCDANHYHLPAASRHRLLLAFTELYEHRDRHFGNGRLVRNCFEESVRQLANRVAEIVPLTEELLTRLEPEDVNVPGVGNDAIDRLVAQNDLLRVTCATCGKRLKVQPRLLGRKVRCRDCENIFNADWAEVERGDETL